MDIVILDSAYKHNVTRESILYCLFHLHNDIVINDVLSKRLFVGFDHIGNALEVIAVVDDEQDRLVVIHAMKLRKQFYHLLLNEGKL